MERTGGGSSETSGTPPQGRSGQVGVEVVAPEDDAEVPPRPCSGEARPLPGLAALPLTGSWERRGGMTDGPGRTSTFGPASNAPVHRCPSGSPSSHPNRRRRPSPWVGQVAGAGDPDDRERRQEFGNPRQDPDTPATTGDEKTSLRTLVLTRTDLRSAPGHPRFPPRRHQERPLSVSPDASRLRRRTGVVCVDPRGPEM